MFPTDWTSCGARTAAILPSGRGGLGCDTSEPVDAFPRFWLNEARTSVFLQCCESASLTTIPLVGPDAWCLKQGAYFTVMPSIVVKPCGCHGRIRNGSWEEIV